MSVGSLVWQAQLSRETVQFEAKKRGKDGVNYAWLTHGDDLILSHWACRSGCQSGLKAEPREGLGTQTGRSLSNSDSAAVLMEILSRGVMFAFQSASVPMTLSMGI